MRNSVIETVLPLRTIRRFDPRQIEEKALRQLPKAGLYTPGAGGRQRVRLPRLWRNEKICRAIVNRSLSS